MNYLKNRYPFKLLTNIFRMATKSSETLPSTVDVKRNKSDSALADAIKESLSKENQTYGKSLTKKLSKSMSECQKIEKKSSDHKLRSGDSTNSLPLSKTSSEHSFEGKLDKKKTLLNLQYAENSKPRKTKITLDRELKFKLKKLQKSLENSVNSSREMLSEEERPKLKRAYPWQNFNLNNVPRTESDEDFAKNPARLSLRKSDVRTSLSDHSMVSASSSNLSCKSSNQSLRSFNSASSLSTQRKPSKDSLQEIKDQMPLFKSILKKSTNKDKPTKEVTFNNISTIYGPSTSFSRVAKQTQTNLDATMLNPTKNQLLVPNNNPSLFNKIMNDSEHVKTSKKKPDFSSDIAGRFAKYEPLKEEHSFLCLYKNGKRPKTLLE